MSKATQGIRMLRTSMYTVFLIPRTPLVIINMWYSPILKGADLSMLGNVHVLPPMPDLRSACARFCNRSYSSLWKLAFCDSMRNSTSGASWPTETRGSGLEEV